MIKENFYKEISQKVKNLERKVFFLKIPLKKISIFCFFRKIVRSDKPFGYVYQKAKISPFGSPSHLETFWERMKFW